MDGNNIQTVLVTGGAGYVGSVLVPKLLDAGFHVRVLDLYLYGQHVFDACEGHWFLEQIKGDLRDQLLLERVASGCDAVIHLAGISDDPSYDLDPQLSKSINYDAFLGLVDVAKKAGVRRFVYASSASVYGANGETAVTEETEREPLTDYSKSKSVCEDVLHDAREPDFVTLVLRPATVCGYSPRLRLDSIVNRLTGHAWCHRKITVFGGTQIRPNVHIEDITDLYVRTLQWTNDVLDGKTYNVGVENCTVSDIAQMVRDEIGADVEIVTSPSDDRGSCRLCSDKIARELAFTPRRNIREAVRDLIRAFEAKKVPNAMTDPVYSNVKQMLKLGLR